MYQFLCHQIVFPLRSNWFVSSPLNDHHGSSMITIHQQVKGLIVLNHDGLNLAACQWMNISALYVTEIITKKP